MFSISASSPVRPRWPWAADSERCLRFAEQIEAPAGMLPSGRLFLPRAVKLLERELADRIEHREARFERAEVESRQEALIDERRRCLRLASL